MRNRRNRRGSGTDSVAILTYHSIDASGSIVSVAPNDFARQMRTLAEMGWRAISLREAVAYHDSNGLWPDRSVVLTFDDGYENFYESALPVLAEHGFTATVFIVSGHMGGRNDWETPPPGLGRRPILSWRQAAEVSAAGIEIGSHTKTHPDLRRLSVDKIEDEIRTSRAEIESRIGAAVESFAYPFGSFNRETMDVVKRSFRAACTTFLQRAEAEPFHALPRIDMYYIRSERDLKHLLNGRLDYYLAIRRLGRRVRRALRSSP
ncbi:MAG TPA: polysaccharide deacetylase family protein [Blastocatellia bacterium]|nr:polysaccharide deacetylase family protein [Blastocatellia bacterium]